MRRTFSSLAKSSLRQTAAVAISLLAASCSANPDPVVADPGPQVPVVEHHKMHETLTPLTLRVRLPARYHAEHVLVFVLMWGTHDWKVMELARQGQAWSGVVSCREVSTITGDARYFFLGLDAMGQPVVSSGSSEWPHVVTIVNHLPEEEQTSSGEAKPMHCHDPADCPPDFPGCPVVTAVRPACTQNEQCATNMCNWDGYCEPVPKNEGIPTIQLKSEEERLANAIRTVTKRYQTAARLVRRVF